MKSLLLLLALLTFTGTSAFADANINFQCNNLIFAPQAGMQLIVAHYRKLCGDLAVAKGLSVQDLLQSDCSSIKPFSNGPDPIRAYQCLEARFGSLVESSNQLGCEVTYHKPQEPVSLWKQDSFNVVGDSKGVDRLYQVGKTLIKVHVDKVDEIASIQLEIGKTKGLTEGIKYARAGYTDEEVSLTVECE